MGGHAWTFSQLSEKIISASAQTGGDKQDWNILSAVQKLSKLFPGNNVQPTEIGSTLSFERPRAKSPRLYCAKSHLGGGTYITLFH